MNGTQILLQRLEYHKVIGGGGIKFDEKTQNFAKCVRVSEHRPIAAAGMQIP